MKDALIYGAGLIIRTLLQIAIIMLLAKGAALAFGLRYTAKIGFGVWCALTMAKWVFSNDRGR